MSSVVLTGSTSGSVTVQAAAVAGSNTATIGAATGTHFPFTAGTAVASTSGTSIDFTSIPSWVKRITVMLSGVSTSGTSNIQAQIGTSGGIQATGYVGASNTFNSTPGATAWGTGILLCELVSAATDLLQGSFTLALLDSSNGTWAVSGLTATSGNTANTLVAGYKTLSGTLDRVRITTANGTDTFDAGTINILYE